VNLPLLFLKDDSMVNFCVEHGVKFVTTSAGDPTKYVKVLKDAGIVVYHAVPSLDGALKAYNAGVDGLVVEGTEGGGFKSPVEVGLTVLIQAIKKQIDIPLIAAGGIVDGIGMASAIAAGADGIQMGTRFVSSLESPVHNNFKNSIIDSPIDGTLVLNKKSKPVIRALKTDLTNKINEDGKMDMSALMNIKNLYFDGDMNAAPALSGQSVGLISEIKPVKEIIEDTINEYNRVCSNLKPIT
jgi:enoyl-[acyl-carrier protein] reductase II